VRELLVGLLYGMPLLVPLGVVVGLASIQSGGRIRTIFSPARAESPKFVASHHLLWIGAGFAFLVPILVFVVSIVKQPIFYSRYLIPGTFGWAILFAWLADYLVGRAAAESASNPLVRPRWFKALCWGAVLVLAFVPVVVTVQRTHPVLRWVLLDDPELPDLPVVCESPHGYFPADYYYPDCRAVYILDWDTALASFNPHETADYKLMRAIKRQYPRHRVFDHDDFLRQYDRFLVLDEPHRIWFETRIRESPHYRTTTLPNGLILVERKTDGRP
jgi:hypothetical protein